jgi:hypothetical protein
MDQESLDVGRAQGVAVGGRLKTIDDVAARPEARITRDGAKFDLLIARS